MNRNFLMAFIRGVAGVACLAASSTLHATLLYSISLDTSPLIGHAAAPFSLEFQLIDGSGGATGNGNNTATLSNFEFGGGSASGGSQTSGGASGSLTAGVVITDSDFFNEFYEEFNPGSTLNFLLELTDNIELLTPDQFSFAILDSTLFEIPTTSFSNVLVEIDIDSTSSLTEKTYAGDSAIPPLGGGPGIAIAAPIVMRVSVPEPTTLSLWLAGSLGLLSHSLRQRRRNRIAAAQDDQCVP